MAAFTNRALGETTADDLVDQPNRPVQAARGQTVGKCPGQVHSEKGALGQFLRNLVVALGALQS